MKSMPSPQSLRPVETVVPPATTSAGGSSLPNQAAQPYVQHPRFYWPSGDLGITIETTKFRVGSHWFTREPGSRFFEVSQPGTSTSSTESSSMDYATSVRVMEVRVTDVTILELEHLLDFWFPEPSRYGVQSEDINVWFSILKLSTKWSFSFLMAYALNQVQRLERVLSPTMSLVDRILLYERHQAPQSHIAELFADLCLRDELLSREDESKLGLERSCKLLRLILEIRTHGGRSPVPLASRDETRERVSEELGLTVERSGSTSSINDVGCAAAPIIQSPRPPPRAHASGAKGSTRKTSGGTSVNRTEEDGTTAGQNRGHS